MLGGVAEKSIDQNIERGETTTAEYWVLAVVQPFENA